MADHERSGKTSDAPPKGGAPKSLPDSARRTRRVAEEIRQRSAEIQHEAERIRSLTMITLLNVDINYRTAQKAYHMVMRNAQEEQERTREEEALSYPDMRRDRKM